MRRGPGAPASQGERATGAAACRDERGSEASTSRGKRGAAVPAPTPRDAAGCRGAGTLLPVPLRASVGESLAPEPASPGGCNPPPRGTEHGGPSGELCTHSVRPGSGGWHSAGLLLISLSCTRGEQGVPRHLHLQPWAFWWPLSVQQQLMLCLQGAASSGNSPSILPTACLANPRTAQGRAWS